MGVLDKILKRSKNEARMIRGNNVAFYGDSWENYMGLDARYLTELLSKVKKVADSREERLKEYSDMLNDGITLSAAELIAEDATQQDENQNRTVWVTSPDKEFEEEANLFLQENVDIENQAFAHAFNIVVYGECYLSTFKSDEEYKKVCKVGEYFEIEPPQNVAHLYKFGKPSGYWVEDRVKGRSSRTLYKEVLAEADFVHFISDKGQNREKIILSIPNEATGEDKEVTYTIRYGSSFLEAARTYYKTRMLIDDILLISRLTRSQFYRLFGIEVGQADTAEAKQIINDVKTAVNNRQSLDLGEGGKGLNTTASPLSTGGNVFYATRDGKGTTQVSSVGGDVDVRAILDVDYFDSKYYGALKVPKQFLGQAEDMPGGLGDTTLTRLDIRYARTVKRVQKVLKAGYRDLLDWYWNEKHEGLPPEYEVNMSKVTTADDDEKAQSLEVELEKVDRILDLLDKLKVRGNLTAETAKEFVHKVVGEVLGEPELADKIAPEAADWKIDGEASENEEDPTEIDLGDMDWDDEALSEGVKE